MIILTVVLFVMSCTCTHLLQVNINPAYASMMRSRITLLCCMSLWALQLSFFLWMEWYIASCAISVVAILACAYTWSVYIDAKKDDDEVAAQHLMSVIGERLSSTDRK